MFGRATLTTPRADGRNVSLVSLLVRAVGSWGELDETVERYVHPGAARLVFLHEVRIYAAENGLMGDDEDILGSLELHDNGLEADDHITVRLPATVPIVIFILVPSHKVLRVHVLDLLVCHTVADTSIKLIQCFPL